MVLLGLAWFLKGLKASDASLLYTLGFVLAGMYAAVFVHLLLSFPTGRLDPGPQRIVVRAAYPSRGALSSASTLQRRMLAPVFVTGGSAVLCFALASATGATPLNWAGFSLLVAIPFGFLAGCCAHASRAWQSAPC
jgi:hypothetical protein